MMITEVLAGGFKTLVVSMLSERVVLNIGDVCWMGIGKLIHIHWWQDCLLNPLKTGSGRETLMLSAYIRPNIDSCCWSVHGWHDHTQLLRQWDGLPLRAGFMKWMRSWGVCFRSCATKCIDRWVYALAVGPTTTMMGYPPQRIRRTQSTTLAKPLIF